MTTIDYCLILHHQDTVQDIIIHTGIVRYLYELYEEKVIIIVKKECEDLFGNHYGDLENITYEIVDDLSVNTIFKLVMNKYKNYKQRMFFGDYDKYRLDSYKNIFKTKFKEQNYDPYRMYNFDDSIRYSMFKTDCINKDCMKLVGMIRSVANMDYRIFSKGSLVPKVYLRNSTIAVHIDKIFNISNFFDSVVLIEKSKHLHLTDDETDDFSVYMYYLYKSNNYPNIFDKKHIYFFHKDDELRYKDLPDNWNFVKYNPKDN